MDVMWDNVPTCLSDCRDRSRSCAWLDAPKWMPKQSTHKHTTMHNRTHCMIKDPFLCSVLTHANINVVWCFCHMHAGIGWMHQNINPIRICMLYTHI